MKDYDKLIQSIEQQKVEALKRAETSQIKKLIKLHKDQPISIRSKTVSYSYEGGYTGDEIITTDREEYSVYIGDIKLKEFGNCEYEAIKWVNKTFAPKKQAKVEKQFNLAVKRLKKLEATVSFLEKEKSRLKI